MFPKRALQAILKSEGLLKTSQDDLSEDLRKALAKYDPSLIKKYGATYAIWFGGKEAGVRFRKSGGYWNVSSQEADRFAKEIHKNLSFAGLDPTKVYLMSYDSEDGPHGAVGVEIRF
jgi:hypothetical protein